MFTIALNDTAVARSVTFAPAELKSCHLTGTAEPRFCWGEELGFESVPAVASGFWKPTNVKGGTETVCGAAPMLGLKLTSPE